MRRRKLVHYILILGRDCRYKVIADIGAHPLKTVPWRDNNYTVDHSRRWRLSSWSGWRPGKREHFLSDILAWDGINRTMTIFAEPDGANAAAVAPLDRLRTGAELVRALPGNKTLGNLTPLGLRSWALSPLYRSRMKKIKIGAAGLGPVVFVVIAILIVLVILMFSGYLGPGP